MRITIDNEINDNMLEVSLKNGMTYIGLGTAKDFKASKEKSFELEKEEVLALIAFLQIAIQ